MECYLYYSFYQDEQDTNVRGVWELHLNQELAHLHKAAELLMKYEHTPWENVVPAEFPKLLQFHDTRDYVRQVLANQIELTADMENYTPVSQLPNGHRFFLYQQKLNHNVENVMSHIVVKKHQEKHGDDYRSEVSPNPVPDLADRKQDNTHIAREQTSSMASL
jgi:hypothetical protein